MYACMYACPSEASFKKHFEELLRENTEDMLDVDASQCPYIPVLDDPFVEREMQEAIKANKAPDLNGIHLDYQSCFQQTGY